MDEIRDLKPGDLKKVLFLLHQRIIADIKAEWADAAENVLLSAEADFKHIEEIMERGELDYSDFSQIVELFDSFNAKVARFMDIIRPVAEQYCPSEVTQ